MLSDVNRYRVLYLGRVLKLRKHSLSPSFFVSLTYSGEVQRVSRYGSVPAFLLASLSMFLRVLVGFSVDLYLGVFYFPANAASEIF